MGLQMGKPPKSLGKLPMIHDMVHQLISIKKTEVESLSDWQWVT